MKHWKIWITAAAVAIGTAAFLMAGCGGQKPAGGREVSQNVKITVGASPVPHGEILKEIKPMLIAEGVDLDIIEFTDYVKPNLALQDKELDANFYQHEPYMEKFNNEHGTDLVALCKVHVEPMGIYSHKIKELSQLGQNAKVAIPNDPTNGGRALLVLQTAGLISLKDGGSIASTVQDIEKNDKNLQFIELDAAQIPRSLDDVDIALINTNYALEAGLNPLQDALFTESKDSPYANVLVVRRGDENLPEIQKLAKALQSPEVKKFIEEKYKGAIIPSF